MVGHKNVQELKEMMDKNEDFYLVDCREEFEWSEAHIDGAIFIPLSKFAEYGDKLTDKEKPVVVQCRSGRRSMSAAQYLESEGFKTTFNLDGGIIDWIEAGFKVTT